MTILRVKVVGKNWEVSYPTNHEQVEDIKRWLSYELSPGYVEWLLHMGKDPHCSNCRDMECDNIGNGDDACKAFMYGEKW